MCWMWVMTECERFSILHSRQSNGFFVCSFRTEFTRQHESRKGTCHARSPILEISVNGVSTIFSHTHSTIKGVHYQQLQRLMHWSVLEPNRQIWSSLLHPKYSRHGCVNDPPSYTFQNHNAALSARANVHALVSIIAKKANNTLLARFEKWVSMERHCFLPLHLPSTMGRPATSTHNWSIGCLSSQKCS